ncbi:hypothetical protein HW555_002893, partial [Spodoptera exigua]
RLVQTKGAAFREIHKYSHKAWMIPSGMNLGGYSMMKMTDSVLFFHRMKLRNNTHFRVNFIHNDISKMMITINLALVDLHLKGAYERALTEDDPSVLIYAPNFGEVEFLLKNVKYLMKGQYRLVNKHLTIELVKSDIEIEETLMMYTNQAIESAAIRLEKEKMGAFLSRLQNDLDEWMKDYFNDYLIYIELDGIEHMQELEKYDQEKTIVLQEYTDASIALINARTRKLNADVIKIPNFTLKSIHGLQISLHDGALHGLNSMFRRSVPTGYKMDKVRKIDSIVAFSNLKVVYKYEAIIPTGVPSLSGELTLTANEVAARLGLSVIEEPDTVDLDIQFLNQMKAESLTVEGPANTLIANFRHVLENEIITLMASSLVHGVESLKSLPHCVPLFIPGQIATNSQNADDNLSTDNNQLRFNNDENE